VETALVWFRRDLRLHDNPALRAALHSSDTVVPVFCFDDRLLHGRHASGSRTQFLLECLEELAAGLRALGANLVIRHGPPERELVDLARATGAGHIHYARDVSPFARRRGERVSEALAQAGIEEHAAPGLVAVDRLSDVRTRTGTPYTVFSPFHRNWLEQPRREVLGAPRSIPFPSGVKVGRLPTLHALGLAQEASEPMKGGEEEGRRRLAAFLRGPIAEYSANHDALGADRTSRLSPAKERYRRAAGA